MNMKVFLAAGALAISSSAASAVSVTVEGSSTQLAGNTADVFAAGFGGDTPVGAGWSNGNPSVTPLPANVVNTYQTPWFATGLEDEASFFAVGGIGAGGGSGSPNALTFSAVQETFRMLWGSDALGVDRHLQFA